MKFSTQVVFSWLLAMATADDLSTTKSLNGRLLSLDKLSRVMRTTVVEVCADASDPHQTWNTLVQAEQDRRVVAQNTTAAAPLLRRSTRRRDEPELPFLVCDLEVGVSGEARKQFLSQSLGTEALASLYNKNDMSCFSLLSTDSKISGLSDSFESVPILPEMKILPGTLDAIADPDVVFGRIETMICAGTKNEASVLREIADFVKGSRDVARKLRVNDFLASREQIVVRSNHPWHRALQNEAVVDVDCKAMMANASVDSFGDTIMFSVPTLTYEEQDEWRSCLQVLVMDLSLLEDVCFVGVYEEPQILNDLASGIIQSGSVGTKPFYDVGLDGKGQVVALSDSGIDLDNCYFYDSQETTPKTAIGKVQGPINLRARKVIQYVSYADDSDYAKGHGSKYIYRILCWNCL